jgi:hypothetical protein
MFPHQQGAFPSQNCDFPRESFILISFCYSVSLSVCFICIPLMADDKTLNIFCDYRKMLLFPLMLCLASFFGRSHSALKGHGNEPDFPRFLHKSVRHRSHKLHFEPFQFWLRILGDIRIRKTTPRLNDTGSRRLSVSRVRGVGDSPTQRYGESTTLRITDTRSRRLPASPIRRVGY